MSPLSRATKLLGRSMRAGRHGFLFTGTRRANLPARLFLAGRRVDLCFPKDHSLVSDLCNVILDDEYGLRSAPGPIDNIVDIGANIGLFCLWARHCFPAARISAYEPNPSILPFTRRNLDGLNVALHAEGVSSKEGWAQMSSAASSRLQRAQASENGEIRLVGFDTVVQRVGGTIDLLKIDSEGGEWEILQCNGALRQVRLIRMEYHLGGDRGLQLLLDRVRQLGFTVRHVQPNRGFGILWLERLH